MDLVQFILNEAELDRYLNLLAIDFSKPVNKVDITTAMQRLLDMNVCPALLPWICHFLIDREQCVRLSSYTSDWSRTTCGVPLKGSKVGPIIVFLAMVNDVAAEAPNR